MKIINRLKISRWSIPLVFLGVVLITYGYQLSRMGLYWDDWEIIYLHNFHDPKAYWDYFLYARPLTSWIYLMFSTPDRDEPGRLAGGQHFAALGWVGWILVGVAHGVAAAFL